MKKTFAKLRFEKGTVLAVWTSPNMTRILDVLQWSAYDRFPENGEYMYAEIGYNAEEVGMTDEEKQLCENQYKLVVEQDNAAAWEIHGYLYDDCENSRPKLLEERCWTPEGIKSSSDAQKWLLEHYPDYYMGMSVIQKCPGGSLLFTAVPCEEYPTGMWETKKNRYEYAVQAAKRLSCNIADSLFKNKN